ncbi:hypothetical protein BDF19DRAFT_453963 [Syncephalis fuscata]|nr:hypothetical protein BDF19DRAFT_453963 [Syncephalis fuscata]
MSVSPTSVTMFGDETFAVTVERVDDLLDDDGRIIAERVMDVKLNFDINDDDVLVNGVPVDLGLSTIQVETDVLVAPRGQMAGLTADDVEPAFDTGIVKLKVKAQADEILVDALDIDDSNEETVDISETMLKVRRVVVTARILEINGHDVVQTDLIEQVIDIMPSGAIRHNSPKAIPMLAGLPGVAFFPDSAPFNAEEMAEQEQMMSPCHRGAHPLAQHAARAWHRLPVAVRVGLATFFGSLLVLTLFVALPLAMYAQWRERRDPAYRALHPHSGDDDDDASLDFAYDEKKAGDFKDPQLIVSAPPAYEETDALVKSTEETERQA